MSPYDRYADPMSIYPQTEVPQIERPDELVDLGAVVLQFRISSGGFVRSAIFHAPSCYNVRQDGDESGYDTWIVRSRPKRVIIAKLKPRVCRRCNPAIPDLQLAEK